MDMPKEFTPEEISKIIYEEFKKEDWGDVDPSCFDPKLIKNPEELGDMKGLEKVVQRITKKINKKITSHDNSRKR